VKVRVTVTWLVDLETIDERYKLRQDPSLLFNVDGFWCPDQRGLRGGGWPLTLSKSVREMRPGPGNAEADLEFQTSPPIELTRGTEFPVWLGTDKIAKVKLL